MELSWWVLELPEQRVWRDWARYRLRGSYPSWRKGIARSVEKTLTKSQTIGRNHQIIKSCIDLAGTT